MSHPVVRSPRKLTATRRDDPNVRYHYWPEERNYLNRMKTMLMHPEVFKRQEPANRSKRALTPQKRDHKDLYFHQWPEKKNFQFKPPLNLKIENQTQQQMALKLPENHRIQMHSFQFKKKMLLADMSQ
ncbi:hypothetical protein KUTeg_016104 [Tegillarca granosa]|uniref:Uncharacterized protein n=1 Tax=Tegillarca granosa TaxID=220873 RepID=A0ABQ9EJW1_TEGGR|nr:hypothetical protein KUTeg_016104 [Tegillarca granosa]